MGLVVSGFGVENDDRPRVEIGPLAHAGRKVGGGIAARDVEQTSCWIERVGCPCCAAGNRRARRSPPCRAVERRVALRTALDIARAFGDEIKFPDDLSGL